MKSLCMLPKARALSAMVAALIAVLVLDVSGAWAAPASSSPRRTRGPRAPSSLPFEREEAKGSTFLVGARIHVGDGNVIDEGVIEIRGARIVSIGGPERGSSLPSEATIIDLHGKRITPGLIAAATPLGLVEIDLESSTVDAERKGDDPIRAGYDASMAIHADSSLIPVAAIEGITSAAVTPRGGLLAGQVAWIDLVAGDHRGIVAQRRIAIAGQLGPSVHGSRAAAFTRLREVLDDARLYQDRRSAFDRRQTRDLSAHRLDLEALGPVLDASIPLVVRAERASDLLALADLAQETGLKIVIVGATQGWMVAEALAEANIPVIVQPSHNLPGGLDRLGASMDNAARLHNAGVVVGIAVLDEAHNVRNVTQEAGIAVAHGMPAEAALSAVSLEIARIYGMDAHYGSIEVGKVANLVVWEGDPFELSQWPSQVYIRGQAIPMRSRQTLLRDRYRDLRRFRTSNDE